MSWLLIPHEGFVTRKQLEGREEIRHVGGGGCSFMPSVNTCKLGAPRRRMPPVPAGCVRFAATEAPMRCGPLIVWTCLKVRPSASPSFSDSWRAVMRACVNGAEMLSIGFGPFWRRPENASPMQPWFALMPCVSPNAIVFEQRGGDGKKGAKLQ